MTVYLPTTSMACTTAEAAYGTWDFWVYWPDGSEVTLALVASDTFFGDLDGYGIMLENDGALSLYRYDANAPTLLDDTAAATIPADSWVHIRVTRSATNVWNVYYDIGAGWVAGPAATDATYVESDYITLYTLTDDAMLDLGNGRSDRAFTKWHGVVTPIYMAPI